MNRRMSTLYTCAAILNFEQFFCLLHRLFPFSAVVGTCLTFRSIIRGWRRCIITEVHWIILIFEVRLFLFSASLYCWTLIVFVAAKLFMFNWILVELQNSHLKLDCPRLNLFYSHSKLVQSNSNLDYSSFHGIWSFSNWSGIILLKTWIALISRLMILPFYCSM